MNTAVSHYFPQRLAQMAPPSAAIDAIFNRSRDAAAILFLIEDTSNINMVPLWQHLRNSYLPPFLDAISSSTSVSMPAPTLPSY